MRILRWAPALFISLAAPLALHAQTYGESGDVPYVPTPQHVVDAMLKLGNVQPGDVVFDLGCGDGRIVVTAAEKFSATGTGIDLNPKRIEEANENARKAGVTDKVTFLQQNLFESDVSKATLVTLYLLPEVNLKLRPRLLQQLKTGTRIVSHSFDMGEWKPDKRFDADGRILYLWTVTDKAKEEFGHAAERAATGH
ncbi:methyltransferase domain-containing protein [uncultured Paludibaculum sp.]|uniref:SAM-dependent methyltransferase n=1 Tax=uncultured Paludibaculum sp. TaxID=1765020 RepID=UPI002AABCC05|nr:methyltransferase domain-containing protein [uncultured Paludibaculum sp.]